MIFSTELLENTSKRFFPRGNVYKKMYVKSGTFRFPQDINPLKKTNYISCVAIHIIRSITMKISALLCRKNIN